ncbi:hypothetical protein ACFQZ4_35015 [Catellatospora coxensis]|nr:hypothetical protein [Catellatospora coxensis]
MIDGGHYLWDMQLVQWLVPTVASVVAVILSAYALLATRSHNRRALFLDMHAKMLDPEIFRGRRVLLEKINSLEDARALREADPLQYELVNRAVAMLDVLACYVRRGYLDRTLVLEEWGYLYAAAWPHGRYFLLARHQDLGHDRLPWPHLRAFGPVAVAWTLRHKRQQESAHHDEVLALQLLAASNSQPEQPVTTHSTETATQPLD